MLQFIVPIPNINTINKTKCMFFVGYHLYPINNSYFNFYTIIKTITTANRHTYTHLQKVTGSKSGLSHCIFALHKRKTSLHRFHTFRPFVLSSFLHISVLYLYKHKLISHAYPSNVHSKRSLEHPFPLKCSFLRSRQPQFISC